MKIAYLIKLRFHLEKIVHIKTIALKAVFVRLAS
jgi:hypothetical protein